ncbi:PIG-L family deacetylase [Streptomyces sp. NPDC048442]|uniref:PIG-L deacetylase family protein n=1 Tax=Streptomyces sp. NPDC048442 TaxID=3154823 RepID=UPI003444E457
MATLVAFFAHPDDEVLHAGGTLARAAAEGHRVVLVSATDGEMGAVRAALPVLSVHSVREESPLSVREEAPRLAELRASGAALGASRVVHLGYADSGHGKDLYPDPPDRQRFVRAPAEEAAERLAAILREEGADLLLTHDAGGGYGHRDHVRAHEVGLRASELAGGTRVLVTAIPRTAPIRLLRLTSLLRSPRSFRTASFRTASFRAANFRTASFRTAMLRVDYTPRATVTHAVDARRYAARKQAALAAHRSQVWGTGRSAGAFRVLVRIPVWVFGVLLGREWFVEVVGAPVHRS